MTAFADLADLPEDERIALIEQTAAAGRLVGFIVEDDEKADRYVKKLLKSNRIRIVDRMPGPEDSILVRVGPKVN